MAPTRRTAPALATTTLSLAEARLLGQARDPRTGRVTLHGEVRTRGRASARDGSWTAGTLVVAGQATGSVASVPFVAKGVGGLQFGRVVVVEGFWTRHDSAGVQFEVEKCRSSELPHERGALVRYLTANVGGLGRRYALRLVTAFGSETIERLRRNPECVKAVIPGQPGDRVALGVREWLRELDGDRWSLEMAPKLMAAAQIGYPAARRIVSYFSSAEVADLIARRDPYRLLEVPGIGWKSADALARSLGAGFDADDRWEAAVRWAVQEEMRRGHSAVTVPQLLGAVDRLVGSQGGASLRGAVVRCLEYADLVRSHGLLFTPESLSLEWAISDLVASLAQREYELSIEERQRTEQAIARARLSAEQTQAVRQAITRGISILTGGPGTGKTHTLRAVVAAATALGLPVAIAAPTGRAAARASELTKLRATTIHKLLGGPPGGVRQDGPIGAGVLILDEASMVDAEVMAWLARNARPRGDFRLLVVGDECQLPSIGHGQVFADLLDSRAIATTRLTQVHRQTRDSRIVQQAHRLRAQQPLLAGETHDWRLVELPADPARAQAAVLKAVRRVITEEHGSLLRRDRKFIPPHELQVLSPVRRGPIGVEDLNGALREIVNPAGREGPWISGGTRVRVNDRVACISNDYGIKPDGLMNGEHGVVRAVSDVTIEIRLDDGRSIMTRGVQNANLALAFCTTVHRSQGAEFPIVVAVCHGSHSWLLTRSLLYTAITRGVKRVVLCADRAGLAAIETAGAEPRRCTALAGRIRRAVRSPARSDHRQEER